MRALRLLLVVGPLLAACGGDDGPREETPSNDRTSTSLAVDSAAPAAPDRTDTTFVPSSVMGTAFLLAPVAGSAVAGDAQLVANGERTAVEVSLRGATAGATYEGSVRQGSCERMGSNVASLNPASADSLGRARSQTDIAVPIDSLVGSPHVVAYGPGGRPESCGDIPRAGARPPS